MDQPMTNVDLRSDALTANTSRSRLRHLHGLGTLCGFAAGAWLGAAEAPTKLVSINVSPIVISFMMVLGVFLARWTVPALLQRSEEHTSELQSRGQLVCRLLREKKKDGESKFESGSDRQLRQLQLRWSYGRHH